MKRSTSMMAILMATALCASAQEKSKSVTPSAAAKTAFQQQFPGATKVKWEKEKGDYEVNFMSKGTEMSAVIDTKGALKETESSIATADLPAAVKTYLQANYKGKSIKEAAKITDANGTVTYEAEINKSDLIFDAAGKFLKVAKD